MASSGDALWAPEAVPREALSSASKEVEPGHPQLSMGPGSQGARWAAEWPCLWGEDWWTHTPPAMQASHTEPHTHAWMPRKHHTHPHFRPAPALLGLQPERG